MKKVLALLLFSSFVFSAEVPEQGPVTQDKLETLKKGCTDPGYFHNQNPIEEIQIVCDDNRTVWEATDNYDEATFKNRRVVCSRATTSKPNVSTPKICVPCDIEDTSYKCGGYKEVQQTVQMTFGVICPQILAMTSLNQFCVDSLNDEVAASSEKILESKETGRVNKACGVQKYENGKLVSVENSTPNRVRR
jgi:hypothetical protein